MKEHRTLVHRLVYFIRVARLAPPIVAVISDQPDTKVCAEEDRPGSQTPEGGSKLRGFKNRMRVPVPRAALFLAAAMVLCLSAAGSAQAGVFTSSHPAELE